jgi:hypothetical protein
MKNLASLNETSELDDLLPDFDDDPEIDGDCNESQPCRGDEYCDDGNDDLELTSSRSRITGHLRMWWYPVKGIVRRYLRSRSFWFKRPERASVVNQDDSGIPF